MPSPRPQAVNSLAARCARIAKTALPFVIVLLPLLVLRELVRRHAVNIPFLDDWMYVSMDEKVKGGTLTLHDFFAAQMEHRMAFVRGVIMLFHKWWPADYVKQMWLSVALLMLTFLNIAMLVKTTTREAFARTWPLLLLVSLVVFSPMQYQVLLWAMMFQVACPAFFLSTSLVALESRLPLWARFAICLICAECASQTFSTGLLLWPLILPMVWWGRGIGDKKARIAFSIAWIIACAVTMKLYLHDLHNEVDPSFAYKQDESETLHRDFGAFFAQPLRSLLFIVRFLGSHLARGTSLGLMDASAILGGISLAAYLSAFGWWLKNFRRVELRTALLPWLVFGVYSLGAGTLVALGRVWASETGDNVLLPRYVIHAMPLTVSLVMLGWIIIMDLRLRDAARFGRLPGRAQMAGVVLGGMLLINWIHGTRMMDLWESSRLRVATNTLFYNKLRMFDGDISTKREYARRADALGLLNPPMVKDLRLDQFQHSKDALHMNSAMWTQLRVEQAGGNTYGVATGYATLPRRERVADGVFLTREDPKDGHWEIFHVAQVSAMPLHLMQTMSRDLQNIHVHGELSKEAVAGFQGRFNLSDPDLPKGKFTVAAWAFDYKQQKVFPMGGSFEIDTVEMTVKANGAAKKERDE